MNRDSFIDSLKERYSAELRDAYLACEVAGHVDLGEFQLVVSRLSRVARIDGLPETEFKDLVEAHFPEIAASVGTSLAAA